MAHASHHASFSVRHSVCHFWRQGQRVLKTPHVKSSLKARIKHAFLLSLLPKVNIRHQCLRSNERAATCRLQRRLTVVSCKLQNVPEVVPDRNTQWQGIYHCMPSSYWEFYHEFREEFTCSQSVVARCWPQAKYLTWWTRSCSEECRP